MVLTKFSDQPEICGQINLAVNEILDTYLHVTYIHNFST